MVEAARQGASGGEFDAGKMAQAAAEEFKDAAPAIYGMALLGIVPQAGARRMIERVGGGNSDQQSQRPADNVRNAPESAALISPSENVSESQGENYSEAFGAGETEDARAFRSELAEVEAGTLPTYKILKLGRPSETLLGIGVPDGSISLRQSVIKKSSKNMA